MAGKKTPRSKRKHDYRYREGRKQVLKLSVLLLKADIERKHKELLAELTRIEAMAERM